MDSMSETKRQMYGSNLIAVCIDQMKDGDYSGSIWNQYEETARSFTGSMELVQRIDRLLDELHFPERATMPRSFDGEVETYNAAPRLTQSQVMEMGALAEKRGRIATFIVRVKYRQNATWQGEAMYVEKAQKADFISALEFIRLIDEAVKQ